jgi:hypothetical protein
MILSTYVSLLSATSDADNCSEFSLRFDHIKYAALDARLGFGIARRHYRLVGYNTITGQLNI